MPDGSRGDQINAFADLDRSRLRPERPKASCSPSVIAWRVRPDELEVGPVYGLAILSDDPAASRLALFMLSDRGQAIIAAGGLLSLLPTR